MNAKCLLLGFAGAIAGCALWNRYQEGKLSFPSLNPSETGPEETVKYRYSDGVFVNTIKSYKTVQYMTIGKSDFVIFENPVFESVNDSCEVVEITE